MAWKPHLLLGGKDADVAVDALLLRRLGKSQASPTLLQQIPTIH